ncbi:hypothetical protein MPSEU_000957600 [Mayamaea pseudoterrestris]|nr:hypothetical protein MPSEU_000957600 [Mayamaea pseudoterrestris]
MVPGSPARRRRKELSTVDATADDNDDEESSFFVLVLKVGSSLACLLLFAFALHTTYWRVYPVNETADFDDDAFNLNAPSEQQQQEHDPELDKLLEEAAQELANEKLQLQEPRSATLKPTPKALAHLNVSDWSSQTDVYGLAERYQWQQRQAYESEHASNNSQQQLATFWRAAQSLRSEFAEKYGGENAARYILEHGLNRFVGNESFHLQNSPDLPSSLVHTACRIKQAQVSNRPFRFVFGGYSVTNGRGNYFAQSYPFVMEQLLHTPFFLLGVQLKVLNHAIGGCPSFPYGWCLNEFMGTDADVISWDFGMNEAGGDPVGLEAYIRQVLTQLPQRPMLIVKDTPLATQRRELLQHYSRYLNDPLLLLSDAAADWFLELPQSQRPSGFAEWRKFGAPPGAPGQVVHHPGVKEHEFIAWILTMHFLSILEIVAADDGVLLQCLPLEAPSGSLPRPLAVEATQTNLTKPWTAMFFGQASAELGNDVHWSMNRIHCRTTFEPIVKGDLSSLVVVGSVGENVNVMLPKSNMFYNRGWVLDMSDQEKKAKRKLELFGDLGFIDSKKAYYGLFTSKAMRLLLPYDGNLSPRPGDLASSFFRSIVVCEVNEKRDYGACDLSQDVLFMIGGVNATSTIIDKTVFMGKKICVHLNVPDAAVFSTRALIKEQYALPSGLLPPPETEKDRVRDAKIGLEVQIRVINQRIMSLDKACSVSHIVWEEANATASSVSALQSVSNNVTNNVTK